MSERGPEKIRTGPPEWSSTFARVSAYSAWSTRHAIEIAFRVSQIIAAGTVPVPLRYDGQSFEYQLGDDWRVGVDRKGDGTVDVRIYRRAGEGVGVALEAMRAVGQAVTFLLS